MNPAEGPVALARRLAKRHSDVGFIRSYVIGEYGYAPSREKIAELIDLAKPRARKTPPMTDKRRELQRLAARKYREKQKALRA